MTTDWSLFDYAVHIRRIYGSLFTPEDVHLAQYVAALNLVSNGITTVLDHCHILNSPEHSDAAVRGLKESGIRGTFCYGTYYNVVHEGLAGATELEAFTLEKRDEDAKRMRKQYFDSNDPSKELLTFGMAPDEFITYSPDALADVINWCREIGARYHCGRKVCEAGWEDDRNRLGAVGETSQRCSEQDTWTGRKV